ncbi:MAG: hypothetical protein M3417_10470 [Actinomycetota bacterium]|nr:hypothetical protein [Actinomycetota bacterium]
MPDAEELRASSDIAEAPAPAAAPGRRPTATALLVWVHLTDLDGPGDPSLDEEALILVPGSTLAVLTALERVPETLALLVRGDRDGPPPACSRCGTVLPGSDAQRAAQTRGARSRRRSHDRRAA